MALGQGIVISIMVKAFNQEAMSAAYLRNFLQQDLRFGATKRKEPQLRL